MGSPRHATTRRAPYRADLSRVAASALHCEACQVGAVCPTHVKKGFPMSDPQGGPPPVSLPASQLPNGLQYIDVMTGSGDEARAGQNVTVHYTGWLTTGQKFDSSRDRNQPFTFRL